MNRGGTGGTQRGWWLLLEWPCLRTSRGKISGWSRSAPIWLLQKKLMLMNRWVDKSSSSFIPIWKLTTIWRKNLRLIKTIIAWFTSTREMYVNSNRQPSSSWSCNSATTNSNYVLLTADTKKKRSSNIFQEASPRWKNILTRWLALLHSS